MIVHEKIGRFFGWDSQIDGKFFVRMIFDLQLKKNFSIDASMAGSSEIKDASKMMLGFIVRRCAADLGHHPSPDEFATWANGNGSRLCLFGKEISSAAAKAMFNQPGRLVTVSPEGLARIWSSNRR
jgi:hypothetical protein